MRTDIDMTTFPRRSHFDYFRAMAYPYVGLTANVDVTGPVGYAKARGQSPFLACLWVAGRAVNSVPELRQRIRGDGIVEFDHCNMGHTVALPDHTFCSCHTDGRLPIDEFLPYARLLQAACMTKPAFADPPEEEFGLFFVSCVPWVEFTQCIQPVPVPGDSTPRVVFGKFIREGERIKMPLHIQCNHALVDGYHLGQFYQQFQALADSLLEA